MLSLQKHECLSKENCLLAQTLSFCLLSSSVTAWTDRPESGEMLKQVKLKGCIPKEDTQHLDEIEAH